MQIEVTEWGRRIDSRNPILPEYFAVHYRVLLSMEEVKNLTFSLSAAPLQDYLESIEDSNYQLLAEEHELCNMGLGRLVEQIAEAVLKAEADRKGCADHCYYRRSPLRVT